MTAFQKRLWIGLGIMALLSPLGLVLPELFHSGAAWGEWNVAALAKLLGFIPEGLQKYSGLWQAPVADYTVGEHVSGGWRFASYIFSAMLGMLCVAVAVFGISRLMVKREKRDS